ncbi:putative UDP-glucuronosyltransferase ugt-48 [Aphelenchoides fujianensis]|nr:putative UDP-glucuronosyltransferase ugt-48 [Aphelenchoides fujianensis]
MLSALLFCGFLLPAAAHRFLFVSINIGHSHLAFSGQLADKLVEHGHEVDFMVSRMTSFVQGNGSRLANVFHFTPKSSEEINALMMQAPLYQDVFQHEVDIFSKEVMPLFTRAWELFGKDLLSDQELFERLKSRNYDAAISEAFDSCAQVLFHKLGIKSTIGTVATPMSEVVTYSLGIPALPSFVPVMNHSPERPLEMTFWERVVNFYNYAHSNYETLPTMNAVFDKPGPLRDELLSTDFPSIIDLKANMAAIFLNTFELLDLPRPTLPHIRHVGGIALKQPKKQMDAVNKREISETSVTAALSQVLDDPQYRRRAQELSRALRNEASDRTARFVRDVEFATEFSAELTRQRIPQLNLLVFYSVDVIAFFFLLAVCALAFFSFLLSAVLRFAFRSVTRPSEKPKVT